MVINQEVEPQQLKTHVISRLLRPTHLIVAQQIGLGSYQSLSNVILDLTPVEVGLVAEVLQRPEKLGQRFLMSIRHIINSVIILIARVGLVNGIISEMNVKILQITRIGQLIFFSRKANQSLVIEINSQGVARSHQHVDSHIEFQTLIEQRISDVLLNHTPFLFFKISRILSQINASALTSGLRFNNKRFYQTPLPRFNVIVPYFTVIVGVQEGTGIEVIVLREVLLHC